jgi:hypothetical protein
LISDKIAYKGLGNFKNAKTFLYIAYTWKNMNEHEKNNRYNCKSWRDGRFDGCRSLKYLEVPTLFGHASRMYGLPYIRQNGRYIYAGED